MGSVEFMLAPFAHIQKKLSRPGSARWAHRAHKARHAKRPKSKIRTGTKLIACTSGLNLVENSNLWANKSRHYDRIWTRNVKHQLAACVHFLYTHNTAQDIT